jgi:Lysine methyltransferase
MVQLVVVVVLMLLQVLPLALIVWETSYLLANYLLELVVAAQQQQQNQQQDNKRQDNNNHHPHTTVFGKTLEVGVGCGLLGQVLAAATVAANKTTSSTAAVVACEYVIVTETDEALNNLTANVDRNKHLFVDHRVDCDDLPVLLLHVSTLDWLHPVRDWRRTLEKKDWYWQKEAAVKSSLAAKQPTNRLPPPHSMDTLVGTDVIFAPALVRPLLQTLHHVTHKQSVIYLCVQVRCAKSHELFLQMAVQDEFQFELQDISADLYATLPVSCGCGADLECHILRMTKRK